MTLCVSARSLSRRRRRYTGRCGGEVFAGLRSPKVNWGLRLFPVIAKQTHDWLICILDVSVLAATYRSNARVRYSRGPGLLGVRQNCWGSIRRQATRTSSGENANALVNSRSQQGLNLNGRSHKCLSFEVLRRRRRVGDPSGCRDAALGEAARGGRFRHADTLIVRRKCLTTTPRAWRRRSSGLECMHHVAEESPQRCPLHRIVAESAQASAAR
jgi:hypothetical protein